MLDSITIELESEVHVGVPSIRIVRRILIRRIILIRRVIIRLVVSIRVVIGRKEEWNS
jgi:hypothetical protein